MASLIKTNNLSTPGGETFALPTALPSAASNLTATSGGQLGYGALGFSSDRLETSTGKIGRVFVDKVRCNNASSTLSNFTLDCVPAGVTDLDTIQDVYFNLSGVCATATWYPAIQVLDANNNNLLTSSYSGQMRWRLSARGNGYSDDTYNVTGANLGYHKLYPNSYPPSGDSKTGEIFTKTAPSDFSNVSRCGGEIRITQLSSSLGTFASSTSNLTSAGRILIEAKIGYKRSSVSDTSTGTYTQSYTTSLWMATTQAPMAKIKFYSTSGQAFNEGLCWTETTLNSLKT